MIFRLMRSFGEVEIILVTNSESVSAIARTIYEFGESCAKYPSTTISVMLDLDGVSFTVSCDGIKKNHLSIECALGYFEDILDSKLRFISMPTEVSLHASSAVWRKRGIACLGVSGSGKTTLALSLSRLCDGFMGDEYATLNLQNGIIRQARFPPHIKVQKLPLIANGAGCAIETSSGLRSWVCTPNSLGSFWGLDIAALGAVVFPKYIPSAKCEISILSALEFCKLFLLSSLCCGERASMLIDVTRLIGRGKIPILSVRYGNDTNAARAIVRFLEEEYGWASD